MGKKIYSWKVQISFVLIGVLVGVLVTAQFRSAISSSTYPYDEYKAQKELIKSYSDDQGLLKTKIQNLRKQIDDKQKQSAITAQKSNLDLLAEIKKEIGLESVKGEGVEITLDDGPFSKRDSADGSDLSLVHAADLRDIVNLLFSAQADAVAVNNQRIIASTPISSVGNTILVNNFHILPPFSITAVGEKDFMLQRLNDPNALADLIKRAKGQKIEYRFKFQPNLIIPVYDGDFRLKYVQTDNSSIN